MQRFAYHRSTDLENALGALAAGGSLLAGGTTMVDLMKLNVMRPATLVDITPIAELRRFDTAADPMRFGALARMGEVADDERLLATFPALAESLRLAASQQLRNSATLGGNVLQRTRCFYFRDTSYPCNKRVPGSGCAALEGVNRAHAVLGGSRHCVATHASDWAVALAAFDAEVEIASARCTRTIPFTELHRLPGDTPERETVLEADEIITAFTVPMSGVGRRSRYLKVRDRESYAFATASAAVGVDLDGDTVRDARIALGGVATRPWRAKEAEAGLRGRHLDEASARAAAEIAFEGARALAQNGFKIELGKRVVVEALLTAAGRV